MPAKYKNMIWYFSKKVNAPSPNPNIYISNDKHEDPDRNLNTHNSLDNPEYNDDLVDYSDATTDNDENDYQNTLNLGM